LADNQQRYETIVKTLQQHQHKLTPQRLAIVRILAASVGHPTADAVYSQLKKDFPTMSLATVYRNIQLIKSLGEVLELGFADGSNRYDGNKPYPHPHLVCTLCAKITDPDLESLEKMKAELASETGYEVLTHRLDFFGICPDCQAETRGD
jgi:Fur family peroxide stress response transcriptional regulator